MYKRTGIFASVFTASVLLATGAFAQQIQAEFEELDQDEDGVISQEEAKGTPLSEKFKEADADQDKNISKKELEMYKEQQELKGG